MNEAAKAARREANRKYREAHREELNAYRRKWAKDNPDKIAASHERYWNKKAEEMGLSAAANS